MRDELARLAASEHTRNATALSISSAVVDTYLQLRTLDAEAGTQLAYQQSLDEWSATEARIPGIESAIAKTELALQILVGRSPRLMAEQLPPGAQPKVPDTPREFDSALLLRSPAQMSHLPWIAAEKPIHLLGFLDLEIGSLLRFAAAESYLKAM